MECKRERIHKAFMEMLSQFLAMEVHIAMQPSCERLESHFVLQQQIHRTMISLLEMFDFKDFEVEFTIMMIVNNSFRQREKLEGSFKELKCENEKCSLLSDSYEVDSSMQEEEGDSCLRQIAEICFVALAVWCLHVLLPFLPLFAAV